MRFSRKILFIVLSLVLTGVQAVTHEAQVVVENTTDQVLQALDAEKDNLDANPERIYPLINDLVVPHFDFVIMSRGILGSKIWKATSEEKQNAFITQFRTLLVRTYGKTLLEYSGQQIQFEDAEVDQRTSVVTVRTQVAGIGSPQSIPITYRMLAREGAWKVIDISISGASIIGTYRGSFGSEIRKNGLDSLIQKLIDRNRKSLNAEGQI